VLQNQLKRMKYLSKKLLQFTMAVTAHEQLVRRSAADSVIRPLEGTRAYGRASNRYVWPEPSLGTRVPPSSLPRRRDNLSGKPEHRDRTVRANLATGSLPARRLPACHHQSRKVGSCGRISAALLRVRCRPNNGSDAGALSAYQSPEFSRQSPERAGLTTATVATAKTSDRWVSVTLSRMAIPAFRRHPVRQSA
jgi:hypothetical protein